MKSVCWWRESPAAVQLKALTPVRLPSHQAQRTEESSLWPRCPPQVCLLCRPSPWSQPDSTSNSSSWSRCCATTLRCCLDLLKNLCDVFIPLDRLGLYPTGSGFVGACGLTSSVLSILTIVHPWLKLKPWVPWRELPVLWLYFWREPLLSLCR